jgi:hypothetical protein
MLLSVVVTIVDGGAALRRCLEALDAQQNPPAMEVLVPFDDTVAMREVSTAAFPRVRFLPLGRLSTERPATTVLGQHELYDRRRAAGLAAATGDIVAMLEDRGVPRRDWARMVDIHERHPDAAVGGSIENASQALLNRAVYFCDFGRYQPPFPLHRSAVASDVNVSYKRAAIDSVRDTWRVRYHEPIVHGALLKAGCTMLLSPEPLVDQMREHLQLGALFGERLGWGRLYGDLRVRHASRGTRLLLAAGWPLLPAWLFIRMIRDRGKRPGTLGPFLAAAPLVLVLLCAWSIGEGLAYWLSPGAPATQA